MRKELKRTKSELREEYDLSELRGGIRGKYYQRAIGRSNLVLIDPGLAEVFPDSRSVNRALRVLADAARATNKRRRAR
ncbi:MAG TPA: hypothetical protein VMV45_06585 [Casimicrobiaceae bacterium]|nr:hypothetical protein [Casimicrobiaceae bacterium]